MKMINGVLVTAGIISLLYFIICICCAGLGSSFSFVWLALGVLCFMGSFGYKYMHAHGIVIPTAVKAVVLSIVVVGLAVFSYLEMLIIGSSHDKPDANVEYLIVLGAKVNGQGTVSKSLAWRLDSASEYLQEHTETKVIVSGGQGFDEPVTEADAMKRYLLEKGIEDERIIMEDKSTNTDENILFSRRIIKDDAASVAVVTNSFHLYRAMRIASKQGLTNVSGIAAPTDKVFAVSYYVRESLAVLKYKMSGRI